MTDLESGIYKSDATGISYEVDANQTITLGQLVVLSNDGKAQVAGLNATDCVGVAAGAAYKGLVRTVANVDYLRAKNTVYAGDRLAVRCEGEVRVTAAAGSGITPGDRVKCAADGTVTALGAATFEKCIGYATSAVDSDNIVSIKLI